jgi:hypothetical protein
VAFSGKEIPTLQSLSLRISGRISSVQRGKEDEGMSSSPLSEHLHSIHTKLLINCWNVASVEQPVRRHYFLVAFAMGACNVLVPPTSAVGNNVTVTAIGWI